MSRRFLTPVNLLHVATDPAVATEGDIYYNTTYDKIRVYIGDSWSDVGGSSIEVSDTAPESPQIGSAWYDNTTGSFYIYDGTYWVEVNGVVSLTQEEVQDYVAPLFTHNNHVNITASYDDTNNEVILTGSSAVSGDLTNIDSIKYPDYITFDTTPETIPTESGSIFWDSGDGLPATVLNSNVTIGLGQEQVALVKNATGASIAKGKVVYINGAQGQRPTITLSDADTESTSSKTFGITSETIANGAEGFVTTFGVLRGVNTLGLTQGAALWLSSTAGGYTTTVPPEPAHSVFIGYVVKAHETSGEIFVNIQNGYELTELHGVTIESDESLTDNEVLAYDSATGLWKNQTAIEANIATRQGWTHDSVITIKSDDGITDGAINLEGHLNSIHLSDDNGVVISTDGATKLFSFNNSGELIFPDASIQSTAFLGMPSYDTTDLSEGTNLYFTDERARTALSADLGGTNGGIRIIAPSGTSDATLSNDSATHQVIVGPSGNGTNIKGTMTILASPSISDPGNLGVAGYIDATGSITGSSIIKDGGTSSEFLKADGSVDSNTYLTSFTEEDPIFTASEAFNITSTDTSNWDTAYGWGDHSLAGYSLTSHNHTIDSLSNVVITGTPTDGEALVWDTTTSKWINGDVSVDLSAYAPIVDPVFTNSIEVKGQLKFDVTSGTPGAFINFATIPGLYSSLDIISTDIIFFQSVGDMNISSQANVFINGTSGEYIGTASPNNQIATIGDLSSFLTSYTETSTLEDVTDRGATSSNAISITNATASSSPITGALIVTGGVGIGEDLYVDNDVYVGGNINITGSITGDLTSVDVTNLVVTDPLIYLAEGNPDDSLDIGIFAALEHGTANYNHTGLIRDASDSGKWKLASGLNDPVNNVINFTGATFDTLVLGRLESDTASFTGTVDMTYPNILNDASYNLRMGTGALASKTTGASWNIAIGKDALASLTTGDNNIAIGGGALNAVTSNHSNIGIGDSAFYFNAGYGNIGIGVGSADQWVSGNYNVVIGAYNGYAHDGLSNIIILSDGEGNRRASYDGPFDGWSFGKITNSIWAGDPVAYQYGGTGLTSLGTAGQVLTVNAGATALEWADGGSGAGTIVSATPPASPEEGMTWFDNVTGKLFIYDGTFWVEATNSLNDEAVMDIISTMIGDGTHNNIEITYSDLSNSLSFNVLSEPITDFLTLNESITGTPTGNAGIIVNRGDLSDVAIRFNETEDAWEYTNDGVEYQAIGSGGGAVSTNTALSNSFWLGA
jgi:hypothetical protein